MNNARPEGSALPPVRVIFYLNIQSLTYNHISTWI